MAGRLRGARDVAYGLWVVEQEVELGAAGERLQPHLRLRPAERTLDAAEVELEGRGHSRSKWAPKLSACRLEPHWRSTVVPATSIGSPASSPIMRATFRPCSPCWLAQPKITSSMSAGSKRRRASSARTHTTARSSARTSLKTPFSGCPLPMGVRTASTTTASRMAFLLLLLFTMPRPFGCRPAPTRLLAGRSSAYVAG